MATAHEAKRALWEASPKDDASREFISNFLKFHNRRQPQGFVDDSTLKDGVKSIAAGKKFKEIKLVTK